MLTKRDNYSLGSANIGIGTTTQKARTTTNVTQFVINGRSYFKAATDDLWTLSGTALSANQACVFWLYLNAAGTASIEQSAIYTAPGSSGGVALAFEWPDPVDKAVIGAIVIKSGGSAFTPGTTALTSVATYVNAAGDYGQPIRISDAGTVT